MVAGAEPEMVCEVGALRVEDVRVLEDAGVVVGRGQAEPHQIALADRQTVEVEVAGGLAAVLDDQAVEAQDLLDRLRPQFGFVEQPLPVFGVGGHVQECVAERAAGGVEPGRHDAHAQGQDRLVRDRGALVFRGDQPGHQVGGRITGCRATFGDRGGEVGVEFLSRLCGDPFGFRIAVEEAEELALHPGQQLRAVLDRQPEQCQEQIGRIDHAETGSDVFGAPRCDLVDERYGTLLCLIGDAPDEFGSEERVEDPPQLGMVGLVEVLRQQLPRRGAVEGAHLVVGEVGIALEGFAHIVEAVEYPEPLLGGGVPGEPGGFPVGVEQPLGFQRGPFDAVVGMEDRTAAEVAGRTGIVCHLGHRHLLSNSATTNAECVAAMASVTD